MDLRQLEIFLSVAKHLHFGKAAEELYLSQSTVSQSISRVERELGGELFDRTTRRVRLTPLGSSFLVDAGEAHAGVVAAYERGRRYASNGENQLAVGYSTDVGGDLVALIPRLQARCPGVGVRLRALRTIDQLRALRRRELDVGVCWAPELDDELDAVVIGRSCLVAMVPAGHPFASRSEVDLADLAGEPLIAWPRAVNPALYDCFAEAMDAAGPPWALVGTASGAVDVATRVISGFGVGVLFESVAAARPIVGVQYARLRDGPTVDRVAVWRRNDQRASLRALIELLVPRRAVL
jgi:DNA-binding transcriptional LysR family regulator